VTTIDRVPAWLPESFEVEPVDATEARILDAALERFTADGVSATTMSQIAADAGISRVWLYRYFENRDAVLRRLMGREVARFLRDLGARNYGDAPLVDTVIDVFDHIVVTLRGSGLLQQVLVAEPEVIVPYLADSAGQLFRMAADAAARFLRERGDYPRAEAAAIAEALLRLTTSIVVNNQTGIDFDDARQRRAFARRIIPRLLAPSPASSTQ
jgi:AcrR family transcriptional regulator